MKREKVYDIVRENIITGKVCLHVPPYTNTNKNQNLFQVIDQWKGENNTYVYIVWNIKVLWYHQFQLPQIVSKKIQLIISLLSSKN